MLLARLRTRQRRQLEQMFQQLPHAWGGLVGRPPLHPLRSGDLTAKREHTCALEIAVLH